jgi:outer membrane protein
MLLELFYSLYQKELLIMKKLLVSLTAAAFFLVASDVFAAPAPSPTTLKIGVVDLQRIMQKSSQVAAIASQLEKRFKPRQQNILAARKALQDQAEKLNRNASVMREGDRTKLQNKIIADRANLQSSEISFQQEVNAAQTQETQKFMQKLRGILTQIAKSGSYTMIMIKQGIPYVDDKLDITDAVLTALEKR